MKLQIQYFEEWSSKYLPVEMVFAHVQVVNP
jgi:hypothetical protein